MFVVLSSVCSWNGCLFVEWVFVRGMGVGSWNGCWFVDRMLVRGSNVGSWIECWFVDRMLVRGSNVGSWIECWFVEWVFVREMGGSEIKCFFSPKPRGSGGGWAALFKSRPTLPPWLDRRWVGGWSINHHPSPRWVIRWRLGLACRKLSPQC